MAEAERSKDSGQPADRSHQAAPSSEGLTSRRRSRRRAVPLLDHRRQNWLIYDSFMTQQWVQCEKLIARQEAESRGSSRYPRYMRGLLLRRKGLIEDSLAVFQSLLKADENNIEYAIQVGRSLYLLGRFEAASDVFAEVLRTEPTNVRALQEHALALFGSGDLDNALISIQKCNETEPSARSLETEARILTALKKHNNALDVYRRAVSMAPKNADLLAALGVLYLQLGDTEQAFSVFNQAVDSDAASLEPTVAAGSIMQDRHEYDAALLKYRVSAANSPESAEVWNNVGMALFGKKKYVAAISCLKHAAYLAPLEWMISYNLGLVHLRVQQPVSAFHFLSTAVNLKPRFAPSYGLLGVALTELKDFRNADGAFRRSLDIDGMNPGTLLNYTILLANTGNIQAVRSHYQLYQKAAHKRNFNRSDAAVKAAEAQIERIISSKLKGQPNYDVEQEPQESSRSAAVAKKTLEVSGEQDI